MSNNRILTELPRKGNANRLDYMKMIGMDLKIEYKDEEYEVKIIEYISAKNPKFIIEYNGEIKEIACGKFTNGQFGGILNKYTSDFKVGIGESFNDITVIDREYRIRDRVKGKKHFKEKQKWYKYRCSKCKYPNGDNYEGWIEEHHLLQGGRCNCCSDGFKKAILGINTIWDTDKWMCNFGLSEQDAKTHTKGSEDKVFVICPKCNKKKEIRIYDIYRHKSIGCTCGHGVSYPERFMMNVLEQLNIEYIFQLTKTTFDWCGDNKYDFYIPLTKSVLETHGMQHYKWTGFTRTLKEEQENDRIKYELALQNGIKEEEYVVIDCRYSDKEYIKNNILKSKLNKLFDLSKVDWKKCEEFALDSLVKEVCLKWNKKSELETVGHLAEYFGLNKQTIIKYLKRGAELDWCIYNPKQGQYGINKGRRIVMYDLDGNFIMEESSLVKLKERCLKELNISLNTTHISAVCLGKRKTHQKHIFKYID